MSGPSYVGYIAYIARVARIALTVGAVAIPACALYGKKGEGTGISVAGVASLGKYSNTDLLIVGWRCRRPSAMIAPLIPAPATSRPFAACSRACREPSRELRRAS